MSFKALSKALEDNVRDQWEEVPKTVIRTEEEHTREYLIELLIRNVVEVEFKKKDDSVRTMRCTLLEKHLPRREVTNSRDRPKKEPNKSLIPVFDLDKKAWRCFRIDSVISFTFSVRKRCSKDCSKDCSLAHLIEN